MAEPYDAVSEPIPISLISGRYLLFDVNVVTYLRRTHNICGSLIGGIPHHPQQNVFLGLPVELMPEEAMLLVKKEIGYIIDDVAWHKQRFNTLQGEDRQKYLTSLRSQGLKARKIAQGDALKKAENAMRKLAMSKGKKSDPSDATPDTSFGDATDDSADALFDSDRAASPAPSSTAFASSEPFAITPSTSYSSSSLPQNTSPAPDPHSVPGYALFEHLHSHGYFLMPGLRFGSNFNVYPGDPLRFHAHFLACAFEFDEEFPLLDLIGGGRLGTAVKKGFLIGGEDPEAESESGRKMRTFCIEWGGM